MAQHTNLREISANQRVLLLRTLDAVLNHPTCEEADATYRVLDSVMETLRTGAPEAAVAWLVGVALGERPSPIKLTPLCDATVEAAEEFDVELGALALAPATPTLTVVKEGPR